MVDIYQRLLTDNSNYKRQPILSCYNTIKITLLIYMICWKIEQKQIYSLVTKCSLLQNYLIKSVSLYFERMDNIMVLLKMITEPILSRT